MITSFQLFLESKNDAPTMLTQLLAGKLDAKSKKKLDKTWEFGRTSPSKEYEKEYSVTGISQDWTNPFDCTWGQLEDLAYLLLDYDKKWLKIIIEELVATNPSLTKINMKLKNWPEKNLYACIIGGVCSSFNLDDITDYLYNRREYLSMRTFDAPDADLIVACNKEPDLEYSKLMTQLHDMKANPGWFPSPKTLKKMITQLEKIETRFIRGRLVGYLK